MQMGTGKTKVALDLVKYNNVNLLIYVCPFSTKENIEKEFEKWSINCEYLIVGYESLQSSDKTYLNTLNKLQQNEKSKNFIIADESIFIKNEKTIRFQRLEKLRALCDYALILNGTPLTKNEWDLYNQMHFLSPKIIGMSRQEFLNTFFKEIIYKKSNQNIKSFYKFSEVNAEYLYSLIEPYIFQANLDFEKEEKEQKIFCYNNNLLEMEEAKNHFLNEYAEKLESISIINMLTKLQYLSAVNISKIKKTQEYIKGKRVIVFCNYLKEIELLTENLDCFIITGSTKERQFIIEEFKKHNLPLIMTLGVGSYSLNLQFCNEIVYSSLSFDYAKMEQSKFRIKRLGQEDNIKYTYFLTDCGINRIIQENLKNKKGLSELVKEKIQKGEIEKWVKNI